MNPSELEALPYIKIEDDVIDLDLEVPITSWEEKIRNMLIKGIDGKIVLGDLLKFYSRSLQQQISVSENKSLLKDKILSHLNYFHIHYMEVNDFLHGSNYYELMEDILAYYCTIELELLRKKCPNKKRKETFNSHVTTVAHKILMVLTTFLGQREVHMIHVLLKMKYNSMSEALNEARKLIYNQILFVGPTTNTTEEEFCRYYILFLKYKDLVDRSRHDDVNHMFQTRYGWQHDIKSSTMLSSVLMINPTSTINTVASLVDIKNNIVRSYFRCIYEKKQDNLEQLQQLPDTSLCDNASEEDLKHTLFGNAPEIPDDVDENCVVILSDDEDDCINYKRPIIPKRIHKSRKDNKTSKPIIVINVNCDDTEMPCQLLEDDVEVIDITETMHSAKVTEPNLDVIDLTDTKSGAEVTTSANKVTLSDKPTSCVLNTNINSDRTMESSETNISVANKDTAKECLEPPVNGLKQNEIMTGHLEVKLNGRLENLTNLLENDTCTKPKLMSSNNTKTMHESEVVDISVAKNSIQIEAMDVPEESETTNTVISSRDNSEEPIKSSEPILHLEYSEQTNFSRSTLDESSLTLVIPKTPTLCQNSDSLEKLSDPLEVSENMEVPNSFHLNDGISEESLNLGNMIPPENIDPVIQKNGTTEIPLETYESIVLSVMTEAPDTVESTDSPKDFLESYEPMMVSVPLNSNDSSSDNISSQILLPSGQFVISEVTLNDDSKTNDVILQASVDSSEPMQISTAAENNLLDDRTTETNESSIELTANQTQNVSKNSNQNRQQMNTYEDMINRMKVENLNEEKSFNLGCYFKTMQELIFTCMNQADKNGNSKEVANAKAEINRLFNKFVKEPKQEDDLSTSNKISVDPVESSEDIVTKEDPPFMFDQSFVEIQDAEINIDYGSSHIVNSELVNDNPVLEEIEIEIVTDMDMHDTNLDNNSLPETYEHSIIKSEPVVQYCDNSNPSREHEEFFSTSDEECAEKQSLLKIDDYTNTASGKSSSASDILQQEVITSGNLQFTNPTGKHHYVNGMMTPDSDQNTDENELPNRPLTTTNLLRKNNNLCKHNHMKCSDSETDMEFDEKTDGSSSEDIHFPAMGDTNVDESILLTPNTSEGKTEIIVDENIYECPLSTEIIEQKESNTGLNVRHVEDDIRAYPRNALTNHLDSVIKSPEPIMYDNVHKTLSVKDLNLSKLSLKDDDKLPAKNLELSIGTDLKPAQKVKGLFSIAKTNHMKKQNDTSFLNKEIAMSGYDATTNDILKKKNGQLNKNPKSPVSVLQNLRIVSDESKIDTTIETHEPASTRRIYSPIDRVLSFVSTMDYATKISGIDIKEKLKATASPKKIVYTSKETIEQASLPKEFDEFQDSFSGRLTKINGDNHHYDNYNLFDCEKNNGSMVKPIWETSKSQTNNSTITSSSTSCSQLSNSSTSSGLQKHIECKSGVPIKEVCERSNDSKSSSPINSPPYENITDYKMDLPVMSIIPKSQEPVREGILKNKNEKITSMLFSLDVKSPYERLKRKHKMKDDAIVAPKRVKILETRDESKDYIIYNDVYDEKLNATLVVDIGKKYSELELMERYYKSYADTDLVNHHTKNRCIIYRFDNQAKPEESSVSNPTIVPDGEKFLKENPITGNSAAVPSNSTRRERRVNNVGNVSQRGKRKRGRPPKGTENLSRDLPSFNVRNT